jgi:hypothetical protein
MRQEYRLRALQMRVAGDDNMAMRGCHSHERSLQGMNQLLQLLDRIATVQPQVQAHLVVAAARGMQ